MPRLYRLQPIQRTHHAAPAAIEHVRVDHRRADVGMTEQLLHGANVVARFKQVRGERVAQRVWRGELVDACVPHRLAHRTLKRLIAMGFVPRCAIKFGVRPNPSLNADVPHAWAAPTGGPPVSLFR